MLRGKLVLSLCAFALAGLVSGTLGGTEPPAVEAQDLARRVYERYEGESSYSELQMVLTNSYGEERRRALVLATRTEDTLKKEYTRFTSPQDIAGTGFLSWEARERPDDQFLYLPGLGKIRRISPRKRDRRFVGTDFTYEDLERLEYQSYQHRTIGREKVDGRDCVVLESKPTSTRVSQYGKLIRWIDPDSLTEVRIDYFDSKEQLAKRFEVHRLEKVNEIWTVMDSEMQDLKRKHHTRLTVDKIEYNGELSERWFTKQHLQNPPG